MSLDRPAVALHAYRVKIADLAGRLDALFRIDDYPPDDFAEIEEFCREAGIPLERYATGEFNSLGLPAEFVPQEDAWR
jgi:hypothetical protein